MPITERIQFTKFEANYPIQLCQEAFAVDSAFMHSADFDFFRANQHIWRQNTRIKVKGKKGEKLYNAKMHSSPTLFQLHSHSASTVCPEHLELHWPSNIVLVESDQLTLQQDHQSLLWSVELPTKLNISYNISWIYLLVN